jgi:hypothetical protein
MVGNVWDDGGVGGAGYSTLRFWGWRKALRRYRLIGVSAWVAVLGNSERPMRSIRRSLMLMPESG